MYIPDCVERLVDVGITALGGLTGVDVGIGGVVGVDVGIGGVVVMFGCSTVCVCVCDMCNIKT